MNKLVPYLTYAGAIPFLFALVCLAIGVDDLTIFGGVQKFLSIYTLVISSFLCGAHWGQHLLINGPWTRLLPLISNILAVLLWIFYLTLDFKPFILLCSLFFGGLLFIDYRLYNAGVLTKDYIQIRVKVSLIVMSSLLLSAISA